MDKVRIGHIIGPYALKGELKVYITTSAPEERYKTGNKVEVGQLDGKLTTFTISSYKLKGGNIAIVKFKGFDDINLIEQFTHQDIYAEKTPLKTGYYIDDLIGLDIVTKRGSVLGQVEKACLINTNYHFISGNTYLPFIEGVFVDHVDISNKKIYVTDLGEEIFQ